MTGSFPSVFSYRNGILHVEDVPVPDLAQALGTPFYVYSAARLEENVRAFLEPFAGMDVSVHYANKANPNIAVTRTLAQAGAGADITSVGELERALEAGIQPHKIIFSGVGKTRQEITAALLADIHQINAESLPEIAMIGDVAQHLGRVAPLALRLNPDVDAHTHEKIATGHKGSKFGIDLDLLDEALALATQNPHLALKGFSVHVGSHVSDFSPFREAFAKLASIVRDVRARGIAIERLDLGGGVGIIYDGGELSPFAEYAAAVKETLGDLGCSLAFEPGRRLVGDAGLLVAQVVRTKHTAHTDFLMIDAGMNDLVRPAMYEARHGLVPVCEQSNIARAPITVVGPICESSDKFGDAYLLPPMKEGDLVAILQAGAYGSAMASTYNGRALIPEALVSGKAFATIRKRISVAEQIAWESYPAWMAKKG